MPTLRPAEQRVAEAVLADPAGISESSITAVARMCQTSETTVLRFCRAIGLAGYPELRIALARAAQFEETDHGYGAPVSGDISATDPLSDVVAKITNADARAIEDTAATLDVTVLQKAVDAIVAASRIDIYGSAASGLVGQVLQQKLHRIGLVSFVSVEGHLALTSAAVLAPATSPSASPTPGPRSTPSTSCTSPASGGPPRSRSPTSTGHRSPPKPIWC